MTIQRRFLNILLDTFLLEEDLKPVFFGVKFFFLTFLLIYINKKMMKKPAKMLNINVII
jgi:hypothetical protein